MSFSSLPPLGPFPAGITAPSVLDHFKLAAALAIAKSFDVDLETAYRGIESGKSIKGGAAGDFMVAVPRFRLKGDPAAHAAKFAAEVSPTFPGVKENMELMKIWGNSS